MDLVVKLSLDQHAAKGNLPVKALSRDMVQIRQEVHVFWIRRFFLCYTSGLF